MRELKIADNMRELRIANGYSQKHISELIHIARQTYSLYETEKRIPDLRSVCELSKLYGRYASLFGFVCEADCRFTYKRAFRHSSRNQCNCHKRHRCTYAD